MPPWLIQVHLWCHPCLLQDETREICNWLQCLGDIYKHKLFPSYQSAKPSMKPRHLDVVALLSAAEDLELFNLARREKNTTGWFCKRDGAHTLNLQIHRWFYNIYIELHADQRTCSSWDVHSWCSWTFAVNPKLDKADRIFSMCRFPPDLYWKWYNLYCCSMYSVIIGSIYECYHSWHVSEVSKVGNIFLKREYGYACSLFMIHVACNTPTRLFWSQVCLSYR